MKRLHKIIQYLIAIALTAGLVFYFESDLGAAWKNLQKQISPCHQPINYSIGDFDERFGLSREDFLKAIEQAAQIWDKGAGKKLFSYAASGDLKINLVYDARQDSTLKLKSLGLNISKDKTSYEALKAKYEAFDKIYQTQKTELDNIIKYYEEQKANYEAEVKAANQRGGATAEEYAILEQERKDLNDLVSKIKQKQDELNKTVADINAVVNVINKLIRELNLNVGNYNNIGEKTAGEFQEGQYVSDAAGERINIYQFDDREALIRVLAHELGHALGLEHVDNPQAIMYRLNESGNDKITADDLAELKGACKIK